jgi:hypothetical protein
VISAEFSTGPRYSVRIIRRFGMNRVGQIRKLTESVAEVLIHLKVAEPAPEKETKRTERKR